MITYRGHKLALLVHSSNTPLRGTRFGIGGVLRFFGCLSILYHVWERRYGISLLFGLHKKSD